LSRAAFGIFLFEIADFFCRGLVFGPGFSGLKVQFCSFLSWTGVWLSGQGGCEGGWLPMIQQLCLMAHPLLLFVSVHMTHSHHKEEYHDP
jgi:hypothetical protein